jgi:hypothetical protein
MKILGKKIDWLKNYKITQLKEFDYYGNYIGFEIDKLTKEAMIEFRTYKVRNNYYCEKYRHIKKTVKEIISII